MPWDLLRSQSAYEYPGGAGKLGKQGYGAVKLRNPFLIQAAGLLGATVIGRLIDSLDIRIDFGPWGVRPGIRVMAGTS